MAEDVARLTLRTDDEGHVPPVSAAREQLRLAKGLAAKEGPLGIRSVPNNPTSERAMMERSGEGAAPDKRRQLQNVVEGKWQLAKMNCPKADEGSRQHLAVVSILTQRITTAASSLRLM
jgi:hypothetical protein